MVKKQYSQSNEQAIFIRKKKLKYIKRSITKSQFYALIEKAAQPLKDNI